MKLVTSLLGVAALTFATSAFAQQEETASPASEETPSTTIEETPTPTPATEATATASPIEQPAAQKQEKPVVTPAAAKPTPTGVAGGEKMSATDILKENENRWSAAIGKRDIATIESMVAPDFIGVNSEGKAQNRRAMLSHIKHDKDTYTSTKAEKLSVHSYGSGVAVVVGMAREKGTDKDGKAFDRTYRFADTWMDRNANWQCVASEAMLVGQH
jgi:ketosteroid isomerase-like protein